MATLEANANTEASENRSPTTSAVSDLGDVTGIGGRSGQWAWLSFVWKGAIPKGAWEYGFGFWALRNPATTTVLDSQTKQLQKSFLKAFTAFSACCTNEASAAHAVPRRGRFGPSCRAVSAALAFPGLLVPLPDGRYLGSSCHASTTLTTITVYCDRVWQHEAPEQGHRQFDNYSHFKVLQQEYSLSGTAWHL